MKIAIYQINMDRDKDRVCFLSYENLSKFQGDERINSNIYDRVFIGDVDCKSIEDVYRMFNLDHPEHYKGRSLSVSDVVEIKEGSNEKEGYYYCDSFGFKKVDFDVAGVKDRKDREESKMNVDHIKAEYPAGTKIELINMEGENRMYEGLKGEVVGVDDIGQIHMKWENGSSLALNPEVDSFEKVKDISKIKVLLVQPERYPKFIEINDDLESMQAVVGGMIEEYMPFPDEVSIICNEEGKIDGMPLNRAVYGEDGVMVDIVAGDFFVAYAPIESDKFLSLPKDMADKYYEKFKYPERFFRTENGITAVPFKPVRSEIER